MKIINRKINELVSAEYNPRQLTNDQFHQISDSIKRFGIVDPIIVNKHKDRKDIIVGGHQRVKVARDLEIKEVPTVEVSLTYEKERELNIRLNKNSGEWDFDLLANHFEIEELTDWGFNDGELVGFDADEVKIGRTDDDAIPEDVEPVCKLGDLYQLGEHRLLCGDATKKEDVDKLMNGDKADMVFTDPPWNVDYGSAKHPSWKQRTILNDSMSTEEFQKFIEKSIINIAESSKSGSMTYIVMSAQEWGNLMLTLKKLNYHWSSTIIWNKNSLVLSRKDYHTKYEPIWYGWLGKGSRICPLEDRKQSDVWDIDRPSKSELHPTTKPIALVQKAIQNSSKNKNIVIDSFLGSGSTLIACEKTNRKCYGMEIDPKYCDVIVKRWEDFTGQKAELIGKT